MSNFLFQNVKIATQTQPAMATTTTITMAEINPVINTDLSVPPNYTATLDNSEHSMKNLKNEQEVKLIENISSLNIQPQATSHLNFTGVTSSYTPVSSVPHTFSNQPPVSFTPGKHDKILLYIYMYS